MQAAAKDDVCAAGALCAVRTVLSGEAACGVHACQGHACKARLA